MSPAAAAASLQSHCLAPGKGREQQPGWQGGRSAKRSFSKALSQKTLKHAGVRQREMLWGLYHLGFVLFQTPVLRFEGRVLR